MQANGIKKRANISNFKNKKSRISGNSQIDITKALIYFQSSIYEVSYLISIYIFRVKTVYQNLFFLFLIFVFVILFRVGCEFYYKWVEYPPRRGCYNLTNQIIHGGSGLMPRSELFRRHVKAHVTRLDLAPESTFDLANQ